MFALLIFFYLVKGKVKDITLI